MDEHDLIELGQFKESPTSDCILRKEFIAEVDKADGDDDRSLHFKISTGDVDRDNDTIEPKGWKLGPYKKNPVVLWAHNSRIPPIGKAPKTWIEDDALHSITQFLPEDLADHEHVRFAEMVLQLYKKRFMRAVSVGFRPLKYSFNEERSGPAVDFLTQELLEYSAVPVPANPNALMQARSGGIDLDPMVWWAELEQKEGRVSKEFVEMIKGSTGPSGKTIVSIPRAKIIDGLEIVIEPEPKESKTTISYNAAHPDGTPVAARDADWSGPAEIRDATPDDLRVMCAWVDSEKPEVKGSYKLPHHRAAGKHPLVWRGLTAAMGALLGARGGVAIPDNDRKGVYNHLAKHYRKDFEQEPPEFREYEEVELKELFPEEPTIDPVIAGLVEGVATLSVAVERIESKLSELEKEPAALEPSQNQTSEQADDEIEPDMVRALVSEVVKETVRVHLGRLPEE